MWSWLSSSTPAKELDEQLGGLLPNSVEQSASAANQQQEQHIKASNNVPVQASNQQLGLVLDECISMLREREVQEKLREAGSKNDDMQEALMQLFVDNGVESDLAKQATSVAYNTHNKILQKKVEQILQTASKFWHSGYLRVQKSKLDADGTQQMLRTDTERFMQEMQSAQQEVINLMASLQPKDQALRKQQLLDSLRLKRETWQQQLSNVQPADQTKFLLSLPAEERMSVCKMNLILKMAENEELQIAMTGAAVAASEMAATEEFQGKN